MMDMAIGGPVDDDAPRAPAPRSAPRDRSAKPGDEEAHTPRNGS